MRIQSGATRCTRARRHPGQLTAACNAHFIAVAVATYGVDAGARAALEVSAARAAQVAAVARAHAVAGGIAAAAAWVKACQDRRTRSGDDARVSAIARGAWTHAGARAAHAVAADAARTVDRRLTGARGGRPADAGAVAFAGRSRTQSCGHDGIAAAGRFGVFHRQAMPRLVCVIARLASPGAGVVATDPFDAMAAGAFVILRAAASVGRIPAGTAAIASAGRGTCFFGVGAVENGRAQAGGLTCLRLIARLAAPSARGVAADALHPKTTDAGGYCQHRADIGGGSQRRVIFATSSIMAGCVVFTFGCDDASRQAERE